MNFELIDLRAFIAVADLGSFHRAAKALNLSQPALSRRIQKLEESLALQLQLPFQVGLFSFGLVAAAPDGPSDDESGFDPALG
jgi:hypothetical protein